MAREMDSLTGLLKEDWLKQGLDDELNRAERFGRDLGILMLEPLIPEELVRDLSYPVLKKLGNVSKEVTRIVDVGVRLKNRLLWLLPETSQDGVEVARARVRRLVHGRVVQRQIPFGLFCFSFSDKRARQDPRTSGCGTRRNGPIGRCRRRSGGKSRGRSS